jgi:putative oxidoreductase
MNPLIKDMELSNQLPVLPALGRFLIAIIFIVSGLGKVAAPTMTQAYINSAGLPAPLTAYALAVLIEVGGGILLVVGLHTRIVAVGLALFTLATAIFFHHDFADQNMMIHFLKNIAIVGGLLQVVAFGPGVISLDGRIAGRGGA